MKLCSQCGTRLESFDGPCPTCGTVLQVRDGIRLFAPELQSSSIHFDPGAYDTLVDVEETSFWFRARNRLITWAATRYEGGASRLLEVGCGSGVVLSALQEAFPEANLTGSEAHIEGLRLARGKLHGVDLVQMDARAIPYTDEFDIVGAFDVIEHIEDDELVLEQLHRALRPGGLFLATVPMYMRLWSESDDRAGHVRRYEAGELEAKARAAGFTIERSTSFVTLLFPALFYARRLRNRERRATRGSEMQMSGVTNRILEVVMTIERIIITSGVSMPFGGSQLIVARKQP